MKKRVCYFFCVVALLCSCSEDRIVFEEHDNDAPAASSHITKADALEIANKVIDQLSVTRSCELKAPTFEYVINASKTRSTQQDYSIPDTLAYIINYPNEGGFVIVSSDNHIYPVLAFSNEGHFSFSNDASRVNFIENIGAYMIEADENSSYEVGENDFDGCYVISPMVKASLNQRTPWDKYVVQEYPGCPVGCVAVATALVMTHSKYNLTYHGTDYPFKSVINAIAASCEENSPQASATSNSRIGGGTFVIPPVLPEYTYEQAVDSMAKILYWIGKDVGMTYTPTGSGATSYRAYLLCKDLGFFIPSEYADFDIKEITRYLREGNIVYMRGRDYDRNAGHAWVCDGCYFCVDYDDPSIILDTYIHCDWGWGGSSNGYYSSSVFSASSYNFTPQNYFAVHRDWQ